MPRAKAKSLCCVCCKAVEDGKDEALLCEGQCQKWLHRYCAGVTVDQYEQLSSNEEPFLCFTCCRAQHQQQIIELRGEMEALKSELSQLKAQLQPPPRPQISSNEVVECYPPLSAEREAMPENSSWQPVGKKRRPRKRQRSTKQGATESTEARASSTVSLVTSNVSDKLEGKAKLVGARRVWGTLKACTVGTVKSVISRFCSNTTAKVKRKTKDVQPGKPPKWCFVIHDSEEALQSLESNWDLVNVQTNWKLEPCYKPLGPQSSSENSTPPSSLSPTKNNETVVLQSESPLLDLVQSDREPVTSPAAVISANSDRNKADAFLVQQ